MKIKLFRSTLIVLALTMFASQSSATLVEDNEKAFLDKYSGQSKDYVTKNLGKPKKVDIAVKPSNADDIIKKHDTTPAQGNKDLIEMWYYDAKINYAKGKYFNQAELTFVNNKCVNITLANKKRTP